MFQVKRKNKKIYYRIHYNEKLKYSLSHVLEKKRTWFIFFIIYVKEIKKRIKKMPWQVIMT